MKNFIQLSGATLTIGSLNFTFSISGLVEILVFAIVIYYIIKWIKRTKAGDLLKGALILAAVYVLAKLFKLDNIAFLFEKMLGYLVMAVLVIFQPELRAALEKLGNRKYFSKLDLFRASGQDGLNSESVDAIVRAISSLGMNHTGALIVIENTIDLSEYVNTGISLDAKISTALLEQIFEHNTPLHDGAVIIRGNRIVAATCYLPLSQNLEISKALGTRHRAGLGISEVSDCITLIASEETGAISVARGGNLTQELTDDELRDLLYDSRFEEREVVKEQKKSFSERFRDWKERRQNEE